MRISSRAGNDVTAAYPELVAQAEGLEDALLDGEIVVISDGRPSFEALQTPDARARDGRGPAAGAARCR